MKWMIASDLHGSYYYAQQLQQAFEREQADRLLFLGDLLYHGPRNDLPRDYAPKKVIPLLNSLAPKLLCVRGNWTRWCSISRCWRITPCCRWGSGWSTSPTAMCST